MLTILATNPPSPEVLLDGLASDLTTLSVVIRLGMAATLGALIGLERKMADKPADGRTMMLICAGAAAFVLLGLQIAADAGPEAITRIDSTRVLSYIISGIGFLGAGAILHSKKAVIGLTTAAAIWVAAAIGAACGLAKFDTAFALFGIVIVALWAPWVLRIAKDEDDEDDAESQTGHRRTSRKGLEPTPKNESHDPEEPNDEPARATGNSEKQGKSEKGDKSGKSNGGGKSGKNDKGQRDDKNSKDSKDEKSGKSDKSNR